MEKQSMKGHEKKRRTYWSLKDKLQALVGAILVMLGCRGLVTAVTDSVALLTRRQLATQTKKWIPETKTVKCAEKSAEEIKLYQRSQRGEDSDLYQALKGRCGGAYIEMGALDGVRFSNSFLFNKQFGYKGLLVEITPDNFKLATVNRPNELATVNAAVCSERQEIHWVSTETGATNGVWEFASETFRKRWWPDVTDPSQLPAIQCLPLVDILDQHFQSESRVATVVNGVTHYFFDFFSLDVEGAEWSVLQSIDWKRTAFGILLVERPSAKPEEQALIVDFLTKEQGYVPFNPSGVASNWFKHPDFDRIYQISKPIVSTN